MAVDQQSRQQQGQGHQPQGRPRGGSPRQDHAGGDARQHRQPPAHLTPTQQRGHHTAEGAHSSQQGRLVLGEAVGLILDRPPGEIDDHFGVEQHAQQAGPTH